MAGKDTYEFGDLTKTAMSAASDAANAASEAASSYQFGDITKGMLSMFDSSASASDSAADAAAAAAAREQALAEEEGSAVHVGFLRGYLSVRERLVHMLRVLKEEEGGGSWTIYVTGHSLGGALATLCASDLKGLFAEDSVVMYNFGSPRVGNLAFVKRFNDAVPNAFRVVNDADVVARVPRSRLQNYFHVGRTVLVTNQPNRAVWVEGQSEGVDPLQERWGELSELIDAEVSLLQGLVSGDGVSDHVSVLLPALPALPALAPSHFLVTVTESVSVCPASSILCADGQREHACPRLYRWRMHTL